MTTHRTKVRTAATAALLALAAASSASPSRAEVLTFLATLDGKYGTEPTGSAATGAARIKIDTESRRVSVDMTVDGITVDALWDTLVKAPIGPIHFHKYASPAGGDSVLVLPLPYSDAYQPTRTGLRVSMNAFDYGVPAGLVKSALPFEDFVAALRSGLVVLNVHTDAFNPGEISGRVVEDGARRATTVPPVPGSGTPAPGGGTAPAEAAGHTHAADDAA